MLEDQVGVCHWLDRQMDGRNALDDMLASFSSGHCTGLSLNVYVTGHVEALAVCKRPRQYDKRKDARLRQYESRKASCLRASVESEWSL